MLTSKQEREILDYIRNQRSDIDQIAEFMYNNTPVACDFASDRSLGVCRAIGISPGEKSEVIIGELIRLYKKVYGDDYEIIYKKK